MNKGFKCLEQNDSHGSLTAGLGQIELKDQIVIEAG